MYFLNPNQQGNLEDTSEQQLNYQIAMKLSRG